MKHFTSRPKKIINKFAECYFCKSKITPEYKDIDTLAKFVTERGKIVSRGKSGACSTHQRKVTEAIKRARFIGLLPFVART